MKNNDFPETDVTTQNKKSPPARQVTYGDTHANAKRSLISRQNCHCLSVRQAVAKSLVALYNRNWNDTI